MCQLFQGIVSLQESILKLAQPVLLRRPWGLSRRYKHGDNFNRLHRSEQSCAVSLRTHDSYCVYSSHLADAVTA